jgi:hypothetical protein
MLSFSALGQATHNWWETPKTREAYASKTNRDYSALDSQIPTLSPAEERWLKTEYDDTIAANGGRFTERSLKVTNSREMDIRIAKPHTQAIEAELSALSQPLNSTEEARHWTRLSSLLMDHDFWEAIEDLRRRGVIGKKYIDPLGQYPSLDATSWAQQILNEIVLPYFDSKQ